MSLRSGTTVDASGKSKRILLVELAQDGTVGGSHQCLINIARAMDRRLFTPVACFLEESAAADTLREERIETHVVDPVWRPKPTGGTKPIARRIGSAFRHAVGLVRAERDLRALLHAWNVDLLHQNNSVGLGTEWIVAARSLDIPVVVHQRGYFFGGADARFVTDRKIDRAICISRSVEHELRVATRIEASRVRQIWDFLDPDRFKPIGDEERQQARAVFGAGRDELLLGMVGNLKPWKGQHVVVEALALLPASLKEKIRCSFLGSVARREEDIAYAKRLHERVAELGLSGIVSFPGYQSGMERVYPALDLLIHASVTPEPFGMVIVEAMACGTPVIATRGGGPDDIVGEGLGGRLVTPDDPADLARTLEAVLSRPETLQELRPQARANVLEHFSAKVVMPRLQALYGELIVP